MFGIIISGELGLLANQMNRNGDYDRDRPHRLALFNASAPLELSKPDRAPNSVGGFVQPEVSRTGRKLSAHNRGIN